MGRVLGLVAKTAKLKNIIGTRDSLFVAHRLHEPRSDRLETRLTLTRMRLALISYTKPTVKTTQGFPTGSRGRTMCHSPEPPTPAPRVCIAVWKQAKGPFVARRMARRAPRVVSRTVGPPRLRVAAVELNSTSSSGTCYMAIEASSSASSLSSSVITLATGFVPGLGKLIGTSWAPRSTVPSSLARSSAAAARADAVRSGGADGGAHT